MSVNNTQSRVKNSFRNTMFGFLGLLLYQVFNFATRSVFIRLLGVEYKVNDLRKFNTYRIWTEKYQYDIIYTIPTLY